MNLNRITLIGNLTADPETKETKSGKKLAKIGLAVNLTYLSAGKKKEEVTFFNVIAWGRLGEIVAKYLKKGSKVYLDGRVNNRSYEDKQGVKKYISEVIMENLIMLGGSGKKDVESQEVVEEEVDLNETPFE